MPQGIRILGIDPGSRYMGHAIIEKIGHNRLKYIHASRLVLGNAPLPERLVHIDRFLDTYIETYQPNVLAIEGMFHQKFADAAIKLGHARGVAICACARKGLPVFEYAPTDVKQSITSYGMAEKTQVAAMVKLILGVSEDWPPDASDALALAVCHANRCTIA